MLVDGLVAGALRDSMLRWPVPFLSRWAARRDRVLARSVSVTLWRVAQISRPCSRVISVPGYCQYLWIKIVKRLMAGTDPRGARRACR